MNCRGVSRRLSAYIDDDLSPGIREAMDEHLETCIACKRKLSEFQALISVAAKLQPLTLSEGFQEKVTAAILARQESREVLGLVRYRFTLAGVAFVAAAASIFFLVGPPSTGVRNTLTSTQEQPSATDFYEHPETKVSSFPLPQGSNAVSFTAQDSLMPHDSTSRIDEFILPNVQDVRENVNVKF